MVLLSPGCDTKETFSLELIVAKQYVMNQWEKRDEAGCPENFHKCDAKRSDNMGSLCAWGVCVHGSVCAWGMCVHAVCVYMGNVCVCMGVCMHEEYVYMRNVYAWECECMGNMCT